MKYYKIQIKSFYGDRIASNANFIDNSKEYIFKKISLGEIIPDTPIFDYFFLESFDEKQYWEWALFDVYKFIGETSNMLGALLISKKLKKVLENFKITEPHFYYLSKLLYKGEKKDYYVFQFTGKNIYKELTKYINFSKSEFLNPATRRIVFFDEINDYIEKSEKLYFEKNTDFIKKKIVLNKKLDFFPMQSFFQDNLVSENLKQSIEENGITGFEFFDIDYEVVAE